MSVLKQRVRFQHAVCAAPCLIKIGHARVYTVNIRNNLVRVYKAIIARYTTAGAGRGRILLM